MSGVVVLDACVLYPAPLRDLLLRMTIAGLYSAHWTQEILDECFRSIASNRPDIDPQVLDRTRTLMRAAVPNGLVTGYEQLIEPMTLPDPDDRHVLAAAVHIGASSIVTFNTWDFPARALTAYTIKAVHPDAFISAHLAASPALMRAVVHDQAAALQNPPMSPCAIISMLATIGLPTTASTLADDFGC